MPRYLAKCFWLSVWMFPEETSFWTGVLSVCGARDSVRFQGRGASLDPLSTHIEQKGEEGLNSLSAWLWAGALIFWCPLYSWFSSHTTSFPGPPVCRWQIIGLLLSFQNTEEPGVPTWLSGLRTQHSHCSGSGGCCGAGSVPGLGTSTYCGHGQKNNKQTKKQNQKGQETIRDQLRA